MRKTVQYRLDDPDDFKKKLILWSAGFPVACQFDSNGFTSQDDALRSENKNQSFDYLAGIGVVRELIPDKHQNGFQALKEWSDANDDWQMGYLSYDLKNQENKLHSSNRDKIEMPLLHFFIPQFIFTIKGTALTIQYLPEQFSKESVREIFVEIMKTEDVQSPLQEQLKVESRISRSQYLEKIARLKRHIKRGDIYEVNFCQEFFAENTAVNPQDLFMRLNATSPAPFSVIYAHKGKYLLSASPERYLKKNGSALYAQPIKGTARRGRNAAEDEALKKMLLNDPKERSENVMIVDLVRNDLSRTARRGSVSVEELFGVYTFPQVHQLISTVRSELHPDHHYIDAIQHSFPMGSMTGAPKFRAMELIEEQEESKRGLYSGAVGYITPEKDFDFNVVIRSILYNEKENYLSFTVGGAITMLADPEKEYEECMLKAKAMLQVLGVKNEHSTNLS